MQADPLVVLDFQNDFTRTMGKLPACVKEVDLAIPKVNAAIASWEAGGQDVVIVNTRWAGWIARILAKQSVAPGTPGAQLDQRIVIKNFIEFVKPHRSAFTSPDFIGFLESRQIDRITVCGLGVELAVARTVRDALSRGLQVTLLVDAIAPHRLNQKVPTLRALGEEGAMLRRTRQGVSERFGGKPLPLERTDPVMALRLACDDTKPNSLLRQ